MVLLPPVSQGCEVTEVYHVEDGAVACWFCKMLLASGASLICKLLLPTWSTTESMVNQYITLPTLCGL